MDAFGLIPTAVDLTYVAHSESCALLLDSEGICRWIVPKAVDATARTTRELATAKRCVGAQFVATLDRDVEGLLGRKPVAGKTLLFASVTNGRVTLLRFGPILAFDELDEGEQPVTTVEPAATLVTELPEPPTPTRRAENGVIDALVATKTSTPHVDVAPPLPPPAPSMKPTTAAAKTGERDPPALLAPPPPPPNRSRETLRGVAPPTNLEAPDAYEVMKQFYVAEARKEESELNLQTGSFSYDPTGASSAIASFLKDVAALADTPYSKALGATDVEELHTGSFGSLSAPLGLRRMESPPPPPETRPSIDEAPALRDVKPAVDSELDVATGSFSRVSDARREALASKLDEVDEDEEDIPVSLRRPSGLVHHTNDVMGFHTLRDPWPHSSEAASFDFDADETLRFARVEGGGIVHH